ncbi:MAG: aminopeptidase, partial [Phycisphaerae bacterium]
MRDPRLAKLADILVTYSVSVKKGDLVLIRGPVPAEPLVIEVCRAVVTAGGRPHVRMWPEETEEVLLRCGSAKQLETTDPLVLNEVRTIDAMIAISGGRNSRYLSDCDPKKQALAGQGRRPVLELFMKRMSAKHNPLRWVGTQMPTDSAAQDAEMSTRRFADFVFDAGLLNARNPIAAWKKLATAQQRMCNALSRRRELR